MKRVLIAATLAALACVGCSHKQNVVELAASADSGVYIAATLATLGSFEWDAAPLTNHAAVAIHEAAVAYKQGRITQDDGQKIVDAAVRANDLVKKGLTACNQNSQSGKCMGNEPEARLLLSQARAAMADIP